MGGSSDVPAAPDYTPLTEFLKTAATFSYKLTGEQLDWAREAYRKNQGVSDIVINKALGEMDKMIADSDRYRAQQINIYDPLKEQYAAAAQDYNTPTRQEYEAGRAEADVAAQFQAARDVAQQRLEAYGVDPSQTRSQALDLGTRIAEAAAQASAGNQARYRTEMTGYDMIDRAIAQGANLPAQVIASSGQGGNYGNQSTNVGLATTASGAQTMGTPLQWQTSGNQSVGLWGDILNTGFKNQLDAYEAEQQASSGWGSALGAIGGLMTAFLEKGGAIPEEISAAPAGGGGPVPVTASPSAGAIPDDVPAQLESGQPARLNAGEFVIPADVTSWMGEKGLQQMILKARKEMNGGDETRPAKPDTAPPPQYESVGAIPMRGG